MAYLRVVILGEPKGQGRPRAVNMGALGARLHPDKRSASWQHDASRDMRAAFGEGKAPLDEPVRVTIEAVMPRPKSVPQRLGQGRLWRKAKPDADNVAKAVCDALVEGGILVDDTRVSSLTVTSLYASASEGPHTLVIVEPLEPLPLEPWPAKTRAAPASSRTLL